jgi:nicotinamidase-related amidase
MAAPAHTWREELEALPSLAPTRFEWDAGATALVVVDMQLAHAHPAHGLGGYLRAEYRGLWRAYSQRLAEEVVPNIHTLLREWRERGLLVIYLTFGSELPHGRDLAPLLRVDTTPALASVLQGGSTRDRQILDRLKPRENEVVINKTSRSAFSSTAIEQLLRNTGTKTLVFTGVSTSTCVDLTARDAADRGWYAVLVEDATADIYTPAHEATLLNFAMRWGRVWSTEEVCAKLADGKEVAS